jgi:hypothetical protein
MKGNEEALMPDHRMSRKQFMSRLGRFGAGTCLCAAAASMHAAFGGPTSESISAAVSGQAKPLDQTRPGEKTVARSAKRMEFGDIWVKRFFDVLDGTLDADARRKLMTANGKACFAGYAGPPKKKPGPDAFERFTEWIARNGQAKGYAIEGRVVSFEFVGSAETGQASPEAVCLCPMAEAQKPGEFSPTYCLCSLGYVQEMHERILGRPVEVELVDSVLKGGRRCKFRMTVGENA